jgi:hypothetical protein
MLYGGSCTQEAELRVAARSRTNNALSEFA